MKFISLFILAIFLSLLTFAQHDHPQMPEEETPVREQNQEKFKDNKTTNTEPDTLVPQFSPVNNLLHDGHSEMGKDSSMKMYSAFSRNLPMSRTGSGTSWHPDNSPMFMNMYHRNQWNIMVHYGLFLDYTNQNIPRESGQRGDAMLILPNWYMVMLNRPVGKRGLLTAIL